MKPFWSISAQPFYIRWRLLWRWVPFVVGEGHSLTLWPFQIHLVIRRVEQIKGERQ